MNHYSNVQKCSLSELKILVSQKTPHTAEGAVLRCKYVNDIKCANMSAVQLGETHPYVFRNKWRQAEKFVTKDTIFLKVSILPTCGEFLDILVFPNVNDK